MSAVKRSISAPSALFRLADERLEKLGYHKFSEYIQALVHADVYGTPPHQKVVLRIHSADQSGYMLNEERAAKTKAKENFKQKPHDARSPLTNEASRTRHLPSE